MEKTVQLMGCSNGRKFHGVETQEFSSIENGLRILEEYRLAVSTGLSGVVTIWVDDNAYYHGEFTRYNVEKSRISYVSQEELTQWLTEWQPKIYQYH